MSSPLSFKGRISATQFREAFFLCLGIWFAEMIVVGLPGVFLTASSLELHRIYVGFQIAAFVVIKTILAIQLVKRLHDLNESGWFAWLYAIPAIDLFMIVRGISEEGNKGPNRFGPDPSSKEVEANGTASPIDQTKDGVAGLVFVCLMGAVAFLTVYSFELTIQKDELYYRQLAKQQPERFKAEVMPHASAAVANERSLKDRISACSTLVKFGEPGRKILESVQRTLLKKDSPSDDDKKVIEATQLILNRSDGRVPSTLSR